MTAAVASCLLLGGCRFAGGPDALTPDAASTITVASPAVGQSGLPRRYTCDGRGLHPPLDWSGAPARTESYAIVVDDASAPIVPYIRWIVFDIPATTTELGQGTVPPPARQATNSAGRTGYDPPCPQHGPQGYRFTVYALRTKLSLAAGASTRAAWQAIAAAAIARGRLTVTARP